MSWQFDVTSSRIVRVDLDHCTPTVTNADIATAARQQRWGKEAKSEEPL